MTRAMRVLIVSTDRKDRELLSEVLSRWGLRSVFSSTVGEARRRLGRRAIQLVFCDDILPDGSHRDLLEVAQQAKLKIRVVVILHEENPAACREAIERGAFDVIPFPCGRAEVQWLILRAIRELPA